MKILVTGGAGFLGSHLCENLIKMGHQVTCLDNLQTGSLKNIEPFYHHTNFKFIEHDVCIPYFEDVEGIFNLASPASPIQYQKNPVQTLKVNVFGTYNMLSLARKTGSRFLQASTSEVYGDPLLSPQIESYWGNVNPIGVRSCYDEGKRAAETLTRDFSREFGCDTRIARIFNTYGPRMAIDDGRVVSNFINQTLQNKEITIYGDGTQIRSFCYVDDLIEGLVKLFFADNIHDPINLGNPEAITMNALADTIQSLMQGKLIDILSARVFHELPEDDPKIRIPSIDNAKNLIDWKPITPLTEGLEKTINYFKSLKT